MGVLERGRSAAVEGELYANPASMGCGKSRLVRFREGMFLRLPQKAEPWRTYKASSLRDDPRQH